MAIIPGVPGIGVEVIVDGQLLPEYEDEADQATPGTTHVVKYIESKAGAVFSIRPVLTKAFESKNSSEVVAFYVYVDGNYVCNRLVKPASVPYSDEMRGIESFDNGRWKLAMFQFSDIELSEEASEEPDATILRHLGTIDVYFKRAIEVGTSHYSTTLSIKHITSLPEKKLKGLETQQQVGFKPSQDTYPLKMIDVHYPHGRKPFASCTFKYRPRATLQSLLLIPRSPSPPSIEERIHQMSREELVKHLQEELQKGKEREQAIIIKQEEVKQEGSLRAKRERSATLFSSGADYGDNDDDDCIMLPPKKKKAAPVIDLSQG